MASFTVPSPPTTASKPPPQSRAASRASPGALLTTRSGRRPPISPRSSSVAWAPPPEVGLQITRTSGSPIGGRFDAILRSPGVLLPSRAGERTLPKTPNLWPGGLAELAADVAPEQVDEEEE